MRPDIQSQRDYFKQVLIATINAAIESSKWQNIQRQHEVFNESITNINKDNFKKICLEECVYKIQFPRQIGKTTIVKECVSDNPVILLSPEMVIWKDRQYTPFLFDLFSDFIESKLHKTKWVILIDSTQEETIKLMDSTIEAFLNANNKNQNTDLVFPYFIIIE